MKKVILTLFMALCLSSTIIILKNKTIIVSANPSILVVGDGGFGSIQEAIDNASDGDTIFVHRGTYFENIVINKSITLIGEDMENTIIDGGGKGNVISVKASYVNISRFTIKNSEPNRGCGISIERYKNVINNNKIIDNYIGIQITFPVQSQIYENIIATNYKGMQLIYSSRNTIYKNAIVNNTYGVDIIYNSLNNVFYANNIANNNYGVYFSLDGSKNNVFYHNNFINNTSQVYAEQETNIWSYNYEGNYWSDYYGYDLDWDGIGDIPYDITAKNKDDYPLMGRFYMFDLPFKESISVAIISNSTIFNFDFKNVAETRSRVIVFNASCVGGSTGFSKVTIPRELMESIHTVLVNEEEVNATLFNATDEENISVYVTYSDSCSIKIVYSELLDSYYQLLTNYSELLNKYDSLNESYSGLLEEYLNLEESMLAINSINTELLEQLQMLNETLYNILESHNELQNEFYYVNSSYQEQMQNFKNLMYVFAATTAIFIVTTIYLSKKAHEKGGTRSIESQWFQK